MRGFLAIIISILYISLSISAAINVHFCSGEIESVNINVVANICCCGADEMDSDCCKNESLILELDTDQTITSVQNILPEQIVILTLIIDRFELLAENNNDVITNNYFIPPPNIQPIWLLNCRFTFYG
jgi:hypothetical protein